MKRSATGTILHSQAAPSTTQKLVACLSYGTISISITLFNKAVFSVYGFRYPNFVTTLQIVVSIFYMQVLKGLGLFSFGRLSFKTARQVQQPVLTVTLPSLYAELRVSFADIASCIFLVVVCCFWSHSSSLSDSPYVQVSPCLAELLC